MRKLLIILSEVIILAMTGCAGDGSLVNVDGSVPSEVRDALIEPAMSNNEEDTLHERDLIAAYRAFIEVLEQEAPYGSVPWQDSVTGNSGVIVPGPRYYVNEMHCLYYTHRYFLDLAAFALNGAACKREDGKWRSLN